MASDQKFVDFVLDQTQSAGEITAKKMFGEYGVYVDGKIVGLICDNRLFIKPTHAGRELFYYFAEQPPYEGAKPSFLIEEKLDDAEWLSTLIKLTAAELPEPKPKKGKKEDNKQK